MNLIQLQRGSKNFGAKLLFDDASFAINEGEHVGVIGPNGAGKTTLFKILTGREDLDSGELTSAQSLRIGYLEQESEWALDQTAEEYLTSTCVKPIWELKQLGHDLGLTLEHFARPLHELSGGYRMRMKLLYLIGQEPNLMLLDEPTNFLDLESVLALESFLQSYSGAFLLISHDREFLRRTTESTLEVEAGDIVKFPGNIDDYFEQKAELRLILAAQAANLQAKRKHMQDFVDRFRAKATKARQAQSRMKQLEKMEVIELKDLPVRAKINIPKPTHTGKLVLSLSSADLGYGSNRVLKNVGLRLERGDHLGIVGHNGAGKSTLLKSLAGEIDVLSGTRELGMDVSLSLFSQHSADQLPMHETVLGALQMVAHRETMAQDVLNIAGSLLFSGDDVHKPIRVLSGGEKSRVALGQILLKRSPLLLLDEPTNHLDFDTVEALTESLRDYAGTVIVVSHDRSFIGRIATRILSIRDGSVDFYPGTYDEYVWSLQKGGMAQSIVHSTDRARAGATKVVADCGDAPPVLKRNFKAAQKELQTRLKSAERQLENRDKEIQVLAAKRDDLTSALLKSQGSEAAGLSKELAYCSRSIEKLEEEMLDWMGQIEVIERDLKSLS